MEPERWQRIDELLQAALAQAPAERPGFLAQACAGDEPLCREVESLIASHELAENFLGAPVSQVAAELLVGGQASLAKGQSIGSYEIAALLGTGGMGEVYLAEDTRLGRKIALKLLSAHFARDPGRLHRFEQEARAASSLNHPNIVTIYEIGQADGHDFIATEFIDGVTLRERLTGPPLRVGEALDIAAQVGSALEAAHSAKIVHRDIKPENIMIRHDGYVKVLDFGLAKLSESQRIVSDPEAETVRMIKTDPGVVMGTISYMSPEQVRGVEVDELTDIWGLGVVIYEMLAGMTPFGGSTTSDVIASILRTEPVPLERFSPSVPGELLRILRKTLRKNKTE